MKIKRNCLICNREIFSFPSRIKIGRGKYCSIMCFNIAKKRLLVKSKTELNRMRKLVDNIHNRGNFPSGNKHPNWRGGTTSEIIKRLTTPEWHKIRKKVYKRDNWTCQMCKKHCHNDIQCHHIIPYRITRDNSLKNLITLCKKCHRIKERQGQQYFNFAVMAPIPLPS